MLWYQDTRFQARLAGNYRSKRAFMQDYGGVSGFEWERERYYLVWPDQVLHTGTFESRYTVGVRARL